MGASSIFKAAKKGTDLTTRYNMNRIAWGFLHNATQQVNIEVTM
jgi:hypothetical protein